jgi:uncharacterized RDD family membrane protein YckC
MSEVSSDRRANQVARHRLRVETTRDLQGTHAGFASRTIANVLDALVVLAIQLISYLVVGVVRFLFVRHFRFPAPGVVVNSLVFWGIALFYTTTGWATTGKTTGKQLVGLRVVTAGGEPLSTGRAFARALLYAVLLPGFVLVLFTRRNLSLQDILLGTAVVYDWSYRALGV